MFPFRLNPNYHRNIFLGGLVLMAVALPFSKFLISLSQFILIGNWLWEGDLKNKLKIFFHNKAALFLSSLPLIYLGGIFYSSDLNYALNDLRIKLPLFILPLIFSTSNPLEEKWFYRLMDIFSMSVIASSFYSVAVFFGYTPHAVNNLRDISVFLSHIRFSLLICMAILFLLHTAIRSSARKPVVYFRFAGAFWLFFFLFFLESMTGVVVLVSALLLYLLIISFRQKSFSLKFFYSGLVLMVPALFFAFIFTEINSFYHTNTIDFSRLDEFTAGGEKYLHDTLKKKIENGNHVWLYYAPVELEQEWNKRSAIEFSGKDHRGQNINYTLTRFLTSKNFRKDAEGVRNLSEEEIKAIERGDANVLYLNRGLRTRIHQIIWEINNYMEGENPQGNSITQRLEFWKAAISSIKQYPVFGTGTGDLQLEMNRQFAQMKTLLEPGYWLKPHNQFLTITVSSGILGLIWFLLFLFAPGTLQKLWGDFFYTTFFAIAFFSMFSEDTLDTQAGITFFTFFSCLFLFRKRE